MSSALQGHVGSKPVVRGMRATCASQHPIVTEEALRILKEGGGAVDAGIAACLLHATIQQEMTNHAGTVTCLYYEAATGRVHQLNAMGTLIPGLPAFRPLPPTPVPSMTSNCAAVPGFMPGLQALYERFGRVPWSRLCEPAVHWAEEGHVVSTFEYEALMDELPVLTYFPSGREHFLPNGFLPQVGQRFRKPRLAQTLRRLAAEGPEYFIKGEWAQHFVQEGNRLGWPVKMEHLTAIPPRWCEPLRYTIGQHEVAQLAPPEEIGLFCGFVLGALDCLGAQSLGHPAQSPDAMYYMAHALRRATSELSPLQDPEVFGVPTQVWLSRPYLQAAADILRDSRPKIDLTEHVQLTTGKPGLAAVGVSAPSEPGGRSGSCETSIVDADGNWLQIMNTLQGGGIPGAVVDGVPMFGASAQFSLNAAIGGWLTGGGRMRSCIGHTMVLRDGKPWLALGTPGFPILTVPQVLWGIVGLGMDPPEASEMPRMWALRDDYTLQVESRIAPEVVAGMARLGIRVLPHLPYDWHMGSFQMCWRDAETGLLNACVDSRRAGWAAGI